MCREGREDVIGDVRRVVGMTILRFGNHGFEDVEHVEIGAGIEIGRGQGCCGVQDQQIADSRGLRVILPGADTPVRRLRSQERSPKSIPTLLEIGTLRSLRCHLDPADQVLLFSFAFGSDRECIQKAQR